MTRILIVEDEPNMVAGLRDNFEYEGYEVLTASDGAEGLGRALNDAPDLVILDVMMPKMSGLDVCKQLKAKRPSVPVIMLTARGQALALLADDAVVLMVFFLAAQPTHLQGFGVKPDQRQRSSQFMGNVGNEIRLQARERHLLPHVAIGQQNPRCQ